MNPPTYRDTTQDIAQPLGPDEKSQPNVPLMSHPYGHAGYSTACPAQAVYLHPEGQRPGFQRSRRRRICARVMHLLLLDVILFLVFMYAFKDWHGFVGAVRDIFHEKSRAIMDGSEVYLPHDCVEVLGWNKPDNGGHHHDYSHVVETLIDLPISSDLLYFTSHGSLSNGAIKFVDAGDKDSDVAGVSVRFLYDDESHDLPDFVKVCRLQNGEGKNGVGIFSPQWHSPPGRHHHHTTVLVVVTLPASAAVNALETSMPIFYHDLADMHDSVIFGSVSLHTSNVPIVAKYLSVDQARLQTSNSHILATLNSTDSIDLTTSNSFIEGQYIVTNHGDKPGRINLHTSNAHIRATISLHSAANDKKGGEFTVSTTTTNAPLNIKFDTAPVDSTLQYKGSTSNAPASASLHEAFEGSFSVSTGRWFEAAVHMEDKEDPSGEGRKRILTRRGTSRGHVEGNVSWGEAKEKKQGHADLVTSNSAAHLYL